MSAPRIFFRVPLEPPSVNHYKLPNRGGGWRLSEEAKAFKDAVVILARQACMKAGPERLWKRYSVTIFYALARNTRLDVDNAAKLVLDGLEASGLIRNDADVLDLMQQKRRLQEGHEVFTHVEVAEFEGDEFL